MGSAWKKLPDELSAPARRLTEELRAVKDVTGLSLSELAARTHYSRASWERWLNGKRIVTEQALEALIGAVECNGPALRALWEATAAGELAGEPGDGRTGTEPEPASGLTAPGAAARPASKDAAEDADRAVEPAAGASEPTAGTTTDPETTETTETAGSPEDAEDPEDPAPSEAGPGTPRARRTPGRQIALVAAVAAAVVLLVLAGMRYSSGDGSEPTAVAEPAVSSSTPAKTAPTVAACQAVGCSHKDPKATGCGADARTVQTTNIGKVVAYLRYSQKCQAAWAAITEGQPGNQAVVTTSAGETETALIHWGYDNYSAMVNAADPAVTLQVCGHQSAGVSCTNGVSDLARLVASTPIPIGPASPPPAMASAPAATATEPQAAEPASAAPSPTAPSPTATP
ncbi:DUF2690 domain-containing protein [Streptomyces sp. BE20]|uniref:helix-turn-helix domain-containing protein n=1 Tax=Streptomyces sp. BE20 TaxID=3002525 RepID=UPI002E78A88F|nr:DUF2690 domain-containing protein [Streptomyces sp. BE20]MEE1823164.1 DUF2690 domain-containing protein [Streptomyces sp. BE20]